MKATGQLLKDRREALKVSVTEVSISTKITTRMIQAMESGDLASLPAKTFLRGFVKSYASFLKLDVEKVLKGFQDEMSAIEEALKPKPVDEDSAAAHSRPTPVASQTSEKKKRQSDLISDGSSAFKKVALAGGIIALILLITLVNHWVKKYKREGEVVEPAKIASEKLPADKATAATEAPDSAEATDSTDTEDTEGAGPSSDVASDKPAETQKAAEPAKPVEPVKAQEPVKPAAPQKVAEQTKPAEPVKAAEPATVVQKPVEPPKVAEPAKPVEVKAVAAAPDAAKPATKEAATDAAKAKGKPQEIIIEALDKVDVRFRINNGEEKTVSLSADQVHTIKAVGVVALDLSDGGAVNIIHNGREFGVPGDLGRPKKIKLP